MALSTASGRSQQGENAYCICRPMAAIRVWLDGLWSVGRVECVAIMLSDAPLSVCLGQERNRGRSYSIAASAAAGEARARGGRVTIDEWR
jgi:hypothetical protein